MGTTYKMEDTQCIPHIIVRAGYHQEEASR